MNITSIDPQKYQISQLLDSESKVVFEVPKYQREYTWNNKNWEELFDDLMENSEGYYLGSIICINTTKESINLPKYEVVDGQQRLITLSLFLAALYSTLTGKKKVDDVDVDKYELNDEQKADRLHLKRRLIVKNETSRIRVIPQIQNHNHDDYIGLLSEIKVVEDTYPMPKYAGARKICKAFAYFKKRIAEVISTTEDEIKALFDIIDRINSAIMVMIVVTNHTDAYTLFESLNDRGMPLTAVELIKNILLARLDASGTSNIDYAFNRWKDAVADLGDDYAVQERFFRQNYNAFRKLLNKPFLKDERQYPLGTIATKSNLLDIYEKIVTNDPAGFLQMVTENAKIYASIILNNTDNLSKELRESYEDLQRSQGAPSYLLLLYLVKNKESLLLPEEELIKICQLLTNFFVRRNITDTPPTRDLTNIFMSFIETIESDKCTGKTICEKLRATLVGCSSSDSLFEEKLRGPVYDENIGAVRFILCMIAKQGMTVETKKDLWERYEKSKQYIWTIEHIFPQGQNIPQCWVDMIADGDVSKAKEYQAKYVHTFGNLTITGYNSTLGNKSFQEKKERRDSNKVPIGYLNGLNLNAEVCNKDKWTVEEIQARTDKLVKQILTMFKL